MTAAVELRNEHRLDGLPIQVVLEGLAQLHQMVFVAGPTSRVIWMSDQLGAVCGGPQALLGRDLNDLIPRCDHMLSIADRARRGEVIACEPVSLDREGRAPMQAEVSAFTVEDSREERLLIGIVRPLDEVAGSPSATQDGTRDELDAATTRASQREFLAALLDSSPDAVIATDPSGFVSYANPGAEAVLDTPHEEAIGKPLALFLRGRLGFGRLLSDLQDDGLGTREVEFEQSDGDVVWYSITTKPLKLPGESNAGTVIYVRDITQRRQLHAELERKNEELQNYVRTVSHDLRSPLVSVLGFARLLRQDYERLLDETGLHFLDRIEQGGRTMEALIESLLELSRIGRVQDHPSSVDPRSVLLQLHAELKPRLEENGVELSFPKDGPLLHLDRLRLYQVLSNLIGNAINHMGAAPLGRIDVSWETEGDWVHLCVADTGRGIDAADHERIFEVFQTLSAGDQSPRSTGIGLAIVDKIVSLYGGRIWVESALDCGARFHLTLPRA